MISTIFFFIFQILCLWSNVAVTALNLESINGGSVASIADHPYTVLVLLKHDIYCTGVVIDPRFVLTAGHCVVDHESETIRPPKTILAGANRKYSTKLLPKGVIRIRVNRVYVLQDFERRAKYINADIAVLRLNKGLPIGRIYVNAIKLPDTNVNYENENAILTGYGLENVIAITQTNGNILKSSSIASGRLRFAESTILTTEACQKSFEEKVWYFFVKKSPVPGGVFCSKIVQRDPNTPEGVCDGDSGGPLVKNGILIGLASLGTVVCDDHLAPALYTNVYDYLPFIRKAMKDDTTDGTIKFVDN